MKKNELKDGMLLELRDGDRFILVNNLMLGNTWYDLNSYNSDLTDACNRKYDIVKIYEIFAGYSINHILIPNTVDGIKLLWERKEVDWSKVAFGTKVKVWDFVGDEICEGKFIRCNDSEDLYKFDVFVEDEESMSWRNCELIEDADKEIPTYGEIDIKFENYCRGQVDGCSKCEIRAENCEIEYILKNYNVTKK